MRRLPDVAFFCVDVLSLWVFRAVSAFCRCAILCLFFVLFFDDSGRVPFSIGDLIAGYAPSFFFFPLRCVTMGRRLCVVASEVRLLKQLFAFLLHVSSELSSITCIRVSLVSVYVTAFGAKDVGVLSIF